VIDAFIHKDIYHVGITMEAVLANLDFELDIGDCLFYEPKQEDSRRMSWKRSADLMQKSVNALFGVIHRTGDAAAKIDPSSCARKITLIAYDDHGPCEPLETFLTIFGPCFVKLHKKGFIVKVELSTKPFKGYKVKDNTWSWTMERWKEEMRIVSEPNQRDQ
jgi:hypothetical protein